MVIEKKNTILIGLERYQALTENEKKFLERLVVPAKEQGVDLKVIYNDEVSSDNQVLTRILVSTHASITEDKLLVLRRLFLTLIDLGTYDNSTITLSITSWSKEGVDKLPSAVHIEDIPVNALLVESEDAMRMKSYLADTVYGALISSVLFSIKGNLNTRKVGDVTKVQMVK